MKPTWEPALIKEKLGDRTYLCSSINDSNNVMKRHADQILETSIMEPQRTNETNNKQKTNESQKDIMDSQDETLQDHTTMPDLTVIEENKDNSEEPRNTFIDSKNL